MKTKKEVIPKTEVVNIAELKPHPRNYRVHPEDQLKHIGASLKQHGFYRNVVVAKDGTILAGHGVVQAAKKIGIEKIPCFRLAISPSDPRALKVLAGDNEISRLVESDTLALAAILKDISTESGLLGTGFDERTLAILLATEAPPIDPMTEWTGMPEFDQQDKTAYRQIVVNFKSDDDATRFGELLGQSVTKNIRSLWFPRVEIERFMDKRYMKPG